MDFFNNVLKYASIAVSAYGGSIALSGLTAIGEGKSQNNPGKQEEGMTKIVGGGVIIAVGLILVPQIASLLGVG